MLFRLSSPALIIVLAGDHRGVVARRSASSDGRDASTTTASRSRPGCCRAPCSGSWAWSWRSVCRSRSVATRTVGPPSWTTPTPSERRTCGRRPCRSRCAASLCPCWSSTPTPSCASPTRYRAARPPSGRSSPGSALQNQLWALAGQAVRKEPTATAPRLYEDSLNEMIDQQTVRVAGLNNRVPTEVLLLEVIGAAGAMFLVGLHVGLLGRSLTPLLLAAGLVTFLLFVTFDLDRPTRGFIKVPDSPLAALRASMDEPPAYGGP